MTKRVFDLLLSASGLLVCLPVLVLLVFAIRMETPGSGLFLQRRIGRNGQVFTCCKLRTMASGTREVPTHLADASGLTRLGAFLRRTKLDELPQLWNIVRGEMSFVGPRPCLPSQLELIEERRRLGVLALQPGITGVAQVQGIDMSDPVRLARMDATYIGESSLKTDLRLIWRTVAKGEGRGDRVTPAR